MSSDRTGRIDLNLLHNKPREYHPVYDKEERAILNGFKERYTAMKSPSQKKLFAQNIMFPKLFDWWESKGIEYDFDQALEKSKVHKYSIFTPEC
jgi:hypothetical protein